MHCLDFSSGRIRWQGGRFSDPVSIIATGDQRLIVWADRGKLLLVETAARSPDRYKEIASRKVLNQTSAWPHVVLSEGRLYCKDRAGTLVCFEL